MKEQHCNCSCNTKDSCADKKKKIKWEMLLSHHAPCDHYRTWEIGNLHICTRCAGMLLGFTAGLISACYLPLIHIWLLTLLCAVFMLPAAFDFVCHELFSSYRSHNSIRFGTGVIFGFPIGVLIWSCFHHGVVMPFLVISVYAAVMEIVIAFLFFFRGHLEEYLAKYELAVFGEEMIFHHHDHCDDHDCSCH